MYMYIHERSHCVAYKTNNTHPSSYAIDHALRYVGGASFTWTCIKYIVIGKEKKKSARTNPTTPNPKNNKQT